MICLTVLVALFIPTVYAASKPLVEYALIKDQTYIRLGEDVTGTSNVFSVDGVAHGETPFHVTVDPSDVQIIQRDRLEIVLNLSELHAVDHDITASNFSLILHGMLLTDGTCVDIPVGGDGWIPRHFAFDPPFYKKWQTDEDALLFSKDLRDPRCVVYTVVVGTVFTLQDPKKGFIDTYLHEHTEMTVEGAAPQIESDTFNFNTPGECIITFRCCGDFAVQRTVFRVLTKQEIKRELFLQAIQEGLGEGGLFGYYVGPWWWPISIPVGMVCGIVQAVRILFA